MNIFWSWQSDTPADTGRYFVRDVLKQVAKQLNVPQTDEADRPEDPVGGTPLPRVEVDHDTKGVGGSPPIAETILKKIADAGVFVADVTPICVTVAGKHVPNPNVMIELGYALRVLDHQRIVLVMNEAQGASLAQLPFDLRHWRGPVTYRLAGGATRGVLLEESKRLADELLLRIKPGLVLAQHIRQQNDRILNRRPELSLRHTLGSEPPHLVVSSTPEVAVRPLEEIKSETPLLDLPKFDPPVSALGFPRGGIYAQFAPPKPVSQWTREETAGYNSFVKAYYSAYEGYLKQEAGYQALLARTFEVQLILDNRGTLSATKIDAQVLFPDGIVIYENEDTFPSRPKPPSPPALRPASSSFAHAEPTPFDSSALSAYRPRSTYVYPEERRVEFTSDELKHNHSAAFDTFVVSFATEADTRSFEASYSITAKEPIDPIKGTVRFVVETRQA